MNKERLEEFRNWVEEMEEGEVKNDLSELLSYTLSLREELRRTKSALKTYSKLIPELQRAISDQAIMLAQFPPEKKQVVFAIEKLIKERTREKKNKNKKEKSLRDIIAKEAYKKQAI